METNGERRMEKNGEHAYSERVSQILDVTHIQRECKCGSIIVSTKNTSNASERFTTYWQRVSIGKFDYQDEELAQELPCGPVWSQRPSIVHVARLLLGIARNLCDPSEWG